MSSGFSLSHVTSCFSDFWSAVSTFFFGFVRGMEVVD